MVLFELIPGHVSIEWASNRQKILALVVAGLHG